MLKGLTGPEADPGMPPPREALLQQMLVIVFVKQMAQVNGSGQRPPTRPQAAEMWLQYTCSGLSASEIRK